MNNNLKDIAYAQWLETALQEMIKLPIKGVCINAITKTGEAYTNYYEVSMMDKLTIAGLIQQDAMLDTMAANGMIEYAEDDEEETDGEEEDG
jgi:hypothetical protein